MQKFLVLNLTVNSMALGIEPWADEEILEPDSRAEFEYEEPAEISFSLVEGGAIVSIMSDYIKVSTKGGQKTFKPPQGW